MACRELLCLLVINLFLFVQCDGNKCGVNEEFSTCSQGLCRRQKCSELNKPVKCPRVSPECCIEECVCKEGYLKAKNGTCIPQNKCDLKCGRNEVVDKCPSNCASEYCPTSYCQSKEVCSSPKSCPPPKCKCAFNYRRAQNGTCIPTRECPPFDCSAYPNEEYSSCPPLCPSDDCSQASPTGQCPKRFGRIGIVNICHPTCRCIKGYWRKDGVCVPYEECPKPLACGTNAEKKCVKDCPPERTCSNRNVAVLCRADGKPCQQKCVCKEGYYRNSVGECITKDECPQPLTCGTNEEPKCVKDCPPEDTCSNRNVAVSCLADGKPCQQKCVCKEGYYRNSVGECITKDECPQLLTCGTNEEPKCVKDCPPERTCSNRNVAVLCLADGKPCQQKCVCKEGYYRNSVGECITNDECPQPLTCGTNEEPKCVKDCPPERTCSNRNVAVLCRADGKPCQQKCVCKEGYYRNAVGDCISNDECPQPLTCGTNEEPKCVKDCPPERTCSNRNVAVLCRADGKPCQQKCVCKEGYYRNSVGECITKDECPQPLTCGTNEEPKCVKDCPPERTCSNRNVAVLCRADGKPCQQKCVCKEGYYRNAVGDCISNDECPQPLTCGTNEEPKCVKDCPPERTCSNRNVAVLCLADGKPCQQKCVCKEGYYRNSVGECITNDECPQPLTCGTNEEPKCVKDCPPERTCSNRNVAVLCRADGKPCQQKCVCKEGYYRNAVGDCISNDECPQPLTCGTNEEPKCVKDCPPERTCSNRNVAVLCLADGKPCQQKCVCKEGYYRNSVGECITNDECPQPLTCGTNEEPKCVKDCPPERTCSNCNVAVLCRADGKPCQQKCVCKEGYYRNSVGECITKDECPQPLTCGTNEEPKCVKDCPPERTCSNRNVAVLCRADGKPCQQKCVCKEGYYRNAVGDCISNDECPQPLTCGTNEEPKCVKDCPPERTCSSRNVAVRCAADGKPCEQKCVCKEGYYRNAVGDCITNEECDKCTGDNEYFACGGACDNVCTDLYRKSKAKCDIVNIKCNPKCYCEDGYARDGNGTCVAIADCPKNPTCSDSEVVDSCPVDCPTDNCPANEEQAKIKSCPKPDVCPPATCKCGFNYRRADNGTCIPTRECPPLECTGANEEYNSCPSYCPGEQCSQATEDGKCHAIGRIGIVVNCFPRCTCIKNYWRRDGKCVPYAECKKCPGPNEVFTAEKKSCPPDTCFSIVARFKCDANQEQFSGCVCESGYLRINGTKSRCVPICDCKEMAGTVDCQKIKI